VSGPSRVVDPHTIAGKAVHPRHFPSGMSACCRLADGLLSSRRMRTAHESTPYPGHSGHGTPHVLVVDDDQAVAQPIASYFRRLGCATDVASEREEAEALAVYRRYDLAILDLPCRALEAAAALRDRPRGLRLPGEAR
jgi:PleD family two-component response regulator